MILVYLENIQSSEKLLTGASKLASQLGKTFGVISTSINNTKSHKQEISILLNSLNINDFSIFIHENKLLDLFSVCEEVDASFLFLQLTEYRTKKIQQLLNACRDLRIPYIIFRDDFAELNTDQVIVPVTFLEEEIEKAQFVSAFGRFCGSEILLLPANDYGSKAATNTGKMTELFSKFEFKYFIQKAEKDSFKVEKEALKLAEKENAGLIIMSASRDYGLDDTLFGPKELHLIKKSTTPLLLVNPRGDLYALCD
ncbi:MAG: universal stress protein [Paludibacter sp.]|nr:universal stress protein [Paludibacter sp.]